MVKFQRTVLTFLHQKCYPLPSSCGDLVVVDQKETHYTVPTCMCFLFVFIELAYYQVLLCKTFKQPSNASGLYCNKRNIPSQNNTSANRCIFLYHLAFYCKYTGTKGVTTNPLIIYLQRENVCSSSLKQKTKTH